VVTTAMQAITKKLPDTDKRENFFMWKSGKFSSVWYGIQSAGI
jgi:hypothetical protein